MDKITKKIMIVGVVAAILVIIIATVLGMDPQSLISIIAIIWAILVMVRMYLINSKNKEYAQMLDHLSKILTEENDPERYIEMCNTYIDRVDDAKFKEMLKVNSAAGYATLCRYDEAADVLRGVNVSLLAESHKAILLNNLAQYAFLTDDNETGKRYVEENRQLLLKYLKNKNMAAPFMITFAFDYYFKGYKTMAKQYTTELIRFLNTAETLSDNDKRILAKLEELRVKIEELPNDDEDDSEYQKVIGTVIERPVDDVADEDEDETVEEDE